MHLINLLKSLLINGSNLVISLTSRTSISSVMNMISLGELAKGQYLSNPSIRLKLKVGSLLRKSIEHRSSWS